MSIKKNQNEIFETTDLAIIIVLTLKDFPIERLDRTDPRRVKFVFKKNEELNQVIEDYWKGKIKVDPKRFFQELKILKTRIYCNE